MRHAYSNMKAEGGDVREKGGGSQCEGTHNWENF